MDVVFITTSANNLSNVAVKNGQVIALRDAPGYYYDHDNTRWHVGGILQVTSLPPLNDIVEGSPALYFLTVTDGAYGPGVYAPNDLHTAWIRIAGNVIDEDAPQDSRDYVRRNGAWVAPYSVVFCTGLTSDIQRINDAIDAFYSSNKLYGVVRVVGSVNFGSNLGLNIFADNEDQSLTLDFSSATIVANSGYSGCMLNVSYRGSAAYAGGKVQIIGFDASSIAGHVADIDSMQQVELLQCAFQHSHTEHGTSPTISVSAACPFKMIESSVVFVDSSVASTRPFLLSDFENTPVILTGNTFRFQDPSVTLTEIIADFSCPWNQGYYVVENNVIVGSLVVRTDVDNTPVIMNTALNNTVISEV